MSTTRSDAVKPMKTSASARVIYPLADGRAILYHSAKKNKPMKTNETTQVKLKLLLLLLLPMLIHAAPPTEAPQGWERTVLAAVIVAEAGGEGVKGMEAVYEVIWMRGVERKRSLYAVVTQRKQFSCLNNTTPAKLVHKMSQHSRYKWVRDELLKFPPLTVHTCPAHLLALNTTRANHYHAKGVSPYWAKKQTPVIIGNHLFYRIK